MSLFTVWCCLIIFKNAQYPILIKIQLVLCHNVMMPSLSDSLSIWFIHTWCRWISYSRYVPMTAWHISTATLQTVFISKNMPAFVFCPLLIITTEHQTKHNLFCHDDTYHLSFDKWELGNRMKCWRRAEKSVSIAYDQLQWLRPFHYVRALLSRRKIHLPQKEHDRTLFLGKFSLELGEYGQSEKNISDIIIWEMNGWMALGEQKIQEAFLNLCSLSVLVLLWTSAMSLVIAQVLFQFKVHIQPNLI